jgi:hypothetical protein
LQGMLPPFESGGLASRCFPLGVGLQPAFTRPFSASTFCITRPFPQRAGCKPAPTNSQNISLHCKNRTGHCWPAAVFPDGFFFTFFPSEFNLFFSTMARMIITGNKFLGNNSPERFKASSFYPGTNMSISACYFIFDTLRYIKYHYVTDTHLFMVMATEIQ